MSGRSLSVAQHRGFNMQMATFRFNLHYLVKPFQVNGHKDYDMHYAYIADVPIH